MFVRVVTEVGRKKTSLMNTIDSLSVFPRGLGKVIPPKAKLVFL